ncbi:LCP family protein [Stackebrandtia soli]|uniref:LCP family protein n=1 Tax=Stackebrandtia soli TaxID=1892856 RepID=UPI0039E76720
MTKRRGTRRATKRRSPVWAKIFVGFGSILMVVSAATVGYANIMLNQVNNSVTNENLLGNDAEPGDDIVGPLNFLMIGADLRPTDNREHALADTIMILHINESLTAANIISIPRDLRVTIQDCGTLYTSPCETKINDAYPAGGPSVKGSVQNLAKTVTDVTGVEFDGAAIVNFEGFIDVVKTLGSVELCVPFEMTVAHPKGKVFPKGCADYGYKDALSLVRERYAYVPENPEVPADWGYYDYGRQHMQQHFIKQLLKEANDQGYISDPTKVGSLIQEIGDQLVLDLGGHTPVDFAFALRGIQPSKLVNIRVPSEPAEIDDVSYVVIQPGEQQAKSQALFKAIRSDQLDTWVAANPDWINGED